MPRLPSHWAAHLESGVSHRLGGVHADGQPEICRGLAAQSLPDGRIEVLMAVSTSGGLLDAVRESGRVAYVAALPTSHRSLHVKGVDAELIAVRADHAPLFTRSRDNFVAQIEPFGFCREFAESLWYGVDLAGLAGLRFTPCGAWDQTPGPGAGTPLELLP
ncbi:hypothetical protein [Roseateles sp. LYH14W]|uniref:Pyridoxamine 5'-phosphate oxidase n=1 Tax=Pelomonas parva TaxID=3299032 RepID=A0ABW7F0J5_9BURK